MSHHEQPKAEDTNQMKLERMFAALEAHDWDTAIADIAEDFVQEWPQSGERITGREHCAVIWRNYPGGGPSMQMRRIRGSGDHWTVEAMLDYAGKPVHGVSVFEFRNGKVVHQTDYFADPFEAPAWRSQWVTVGS